MEQVWWQLPRNWCGGSCHGAGVVAAAMSWCGGSWCGAGACSVELRGWNTPRPSFFWGRLGEVLGESIGGDWGRLEDCGGLEDRGGSWRIVEDRSGRRCWEDVSACAE